MDACSVPDVMVGGMQVGVIVRAVAGLSSAFDERLRAEGWTPSRGPVGRNGTNVTERCGFAFGPGKHSPLLRDHHRRITSRQVHDVAHPTAR